MGQTNGLNDKEVIINRKKYGTNIITNRNEETFWKLLLETFGDPIIKILFIALGIKIVFLIQDFDWFETIGIVIAIFIASFISTISEYGSARAFRRLQEESSKSKSLVIRNGKITEIPVEEIVVNDILFLEPGNRIGADGIVIDGNLLVDESSMTGETLEVEKVKTSDYINILDKNRVFRGTVVVDGSAKVLVKKVGNGTFFGKMALELQEKSAPSPLKLRLAELAKQISRIGYVGAFLVAISYLFSEIVIANDFNWELIKNTLLNLPLVFSYILHALTLSVTIIVVAVPEGLPMMITLVLSSNMKKMLKNQVLVRKLVGIETAGSLNILFTDKTGTLTYGKLEVMEVVLGNLKGFNSLMEFPYPKYKELLSDSLVYNNSSFYDSDLGQIVGGNSTDQALLSFVKKKPSDLVKVLEKIAFNSKNKYSLAMISKNGSKQVLVKGAWEKLFSYCDSYYNEFGEKKVLTHKKEVETKITEYVKRGIRVLAVATCDERYRKDLRKLCLVGFVLIKDEVRKDAVSAIELVKKAKIQTVMITGDNRDTAYEIAKEVGLITSENDLVITSSDLQKMNDEEVKKIIPDLRVVARALPSDKSRLVKLSQELDLVVGMTGDGINDAPALKKANVGIAMGSGTEVSKEASDIVILDDNFLSISKAILYGRTIFKSIRKFIIFQLTVNVCAVMISIIGPFIGVPTPVTVIQMLWINMVMDTLAGLAFSYEPALEEYMEESPKKKEEPIINKYMLFEILLTGLYSALLCIVFLKSPIILKIFESDYDVLMSAFFGLFIFIGIFNSFNARTHRLNILSNLWKNSAFLIVITFIVIVQICLIYFGGSLFRTVGLSINQFLIMLLIAFSVIPIDLIRKILWKIFHLPMGV